MLGHAQLCGQNNKNFYLPTCEGKSYGLTKPYVSKQGFWNRYKPFKTMDLGQGFNMQYEKA